MWITAARPSLGLVLCLVATIASAQMPESVGGVRYLPDEVLLAKRGLPWAYAIKSSQTPMTLRTRSPLPAEQKVIERARWLLNNRQAKAIALMDGPTVVYAEYKFPASDNSLFYGASITKTVTAMAIGQAICAGKLKMQDRAGELVAELANLAVAKATVKDLLRMASGAAKAANASDPFSGNILTDRNKREWTAGQIDLAKLVSEDRVARAERGVFGQLEPGEVFAYKNTDPLILGLMLNRATGMSYANWVQQTIFDPMGATGPGWIGQDPKKQALADAGIHLQMQDWIRFAWWVLQASQSADCLGSYVREASRRQIRTGYKIHAGYGYLTWTDISSAPETYWAAGYGGQRIGWSYEGKRMIVAFSNASDWMEDLYLLYREWRNCDQ